MEQNNDSPFPGAGGCRALGGGQMLCHVGTYVLCKGQKLLLIAPKEPRLEYISYMEVIFTKLGVLESGGQVTLR